jgi:WD40 repeat protein
MRDLQVNQEFEVIDSFLSPDARSLAVSSFEGTIVVIDHPSGDVRFKTSAAIRDAGDTDQTNHRASLEFAPDGRSLAFVRQVYKKIKLPNGASRDAWPRESMIVWLDALTGQTRRVIAIPGWNMSDLAFSPDGRLIAAVTTSHDDRKVIRIFRLRDKQEIQSIEAGSPGITALRFTPDGKRISAGLYDTSIVLWDVR